MARIVLTNDDGIDAPGLQALYRAAESLGPRVVVAPDLCRSGTGHAVTTHQPFPVTRRSEGWYAVGGTPADCSRLALLHLAPRAEWVLSGINRGGNLGADIYVSGTVAAAREAALLGHRGVAVSQHTRPGMAVDWEWSLAQCRRVLELLVSRPARPFSFWNVNLPHLPTGAPEPEVVFCGVDCHPLHVRYRVEGDFDGQPTLLHFEGDYHSRSCRPGSDVDMCFRGAITVTELPLDLSA